MKEKSTIERLKKIILSTGKSKNLSEAQISTIIALIDEIHRGGTITEDYLIRQFNNIGGA